MMRAEGVMARIRFAAIIFTLASAIGLSGTVSAKVKDQSVRLAPSTPWSVNYAEEKCRLSRIFSDGQDHPQRRSLVP